MFGTFQNGGVDAVNENNLNVHVTVPLFHKAGRGLPVDLQAGYDSSVWAITSKSPSGYIWKFVNSWPVWGTSPARGMFGMLTHVLSVDPDTKCDIQTYTYVDSSSTAHDFPAVSIGLPYGCYRTTFPLAAWDGSGYLLLSGTSVAAPSGNQYGLANPITATDPNGNSTSVSNTSATDTLGLTAFTEQFTQAGNTETSTYTYTGPTGAEPVVVTYTQYTVASDFACNNATYGAVSEYAPTADYLVTNVTYPDGSQYNFKYEKTPNNSNYTTGRISEVDLPTGGNIQYSYGYWSSSSSMCTDGSPYSLTRTTSDGAKWQYTRNATGTVTTVTDPATNQTAISFSVASSGFETQRLVNQGSSTLKETIFTCYNGNFANCSTATLPGGTVITRRDVYRTPVTGKTALSETFYNSQGLVTQGNEFDYGINTGSAPSGAPLKSTIIGYATLPNNIYDRVACVQATAGTPPTTCGTVTSNTVSLTNNSYDSLGNLKQVSQWVSGSTYLTKSFTYYSDGLLQSSTDVNGTVTNYTPQTCGSVQAFVSGVSVAGLSQTTTWDCNGAVPTQVLDTNSQLTKYGYDSMWRATSVTDPLGNVSNTAYTPATASTPATVETALSFPISTPTSTVDTLTTLDGLGRTVETQARTAPNAGTFDRAVQYTYGWTKTGSVTGPVLTQTVPGGTAVTTTQVDALGRITSVTDGGGGYTSQTYTQNDVLSALGPAASGENIKQVQNQYDALGRLTSSCAISTTVAGIVTCAQNSGSNSGVLTATSYTSAIGGLTVTSTRGSQTRSQTVDGLGRLTSTVTPEGGTANYSYDVAGCYNINYPGHLTAGNVSNGNSYCYAYDSLGRMTLAYGLAPNGATLCRKLFYDNSTGATDLIPSFRTKASMISSKERGRMYVEEQSHGSADDRGAEASGGRTEGGRRGA